MDRRNMIVAVFFALFFLLLGYTMQQERLFLTNLSFSNASNFPVPGKSPFDGAIPFTLGKLIQFYLLDVNNTAMVLSDSHTVFYGNTAPAIRRLRLMMNSSGASLAPMHAHRSVHTLERSLVSNNHELANPPGPPPHSNKSSRVGNALIITGFVVGGLILAVFMASVVCHFDIWWWCRRFGRALHAGRVGQDPDAAPGIELQPGIGEAVVNVGDTSVYQLILQGFWSPDWIATLKIAVEPANDVSFQHGDHDTPVVHRKLDNACMESAARTIQSSYKSVR